MIDLHSHILPGIDDGAGDVLKLLDMLRLAKDQGIDVIVATPHYYDNAADINAFIQKRDASYRLLLNELSKHNAPDCEILLGAEVYLTPDIVDNESLEALCIGKSSSILIEMPYGIWHDWTYRALYKIMAKRQLTPIIAHIERYADKPGRLDLLEKLLKMDIPIQINASSLFDRYLWKTAKKLFKFSGRIVLGSDAHDTEDRKSMMDKAANKISKKFGDETLNLIMNNAKILISQNKGSNILST